MQAVLKFGKSQYLVKPGDTILVDLGQTEPKILLIEDEGKTFIGEPEVAGAKVKVKVLEEVKGEKLRISQFKAKTRHRRVIGFRGKYTKILIEDIKFSQKA
ncbi:MAG: 50S ribosomal protein L21 [Patescibacteria group bacterium]